MTTSNGPHGPSTDALDEVYDALSHPVRRQLLLILQKTNCCTLEAFVTSELERQHEQQAVVIELHHVHLPKLDGADIIEWKQESETIRIGAQFQIIRPHLDLLREQQNAT